MRALYSLFPELSAVAAERADSLAVVSLSIDIEDAWVEASKRHGLTGNNWNEKMVDAGIFQKFGFRPVPDYVLIAPDGTVRHNGPGICKGIYAEICISSWTNVLRR